jgi:large subunit ribosomal protein L5
MTLKTVYKEKSIPLLKQAFGLTNPMAVPKIQKVVVNVGVGRTLKDAKMLDGIIEDIKRITGQTPVKTAARKSIAGFKIREGQIVGVMVTLRGRKMYDFLEKLVRVALPRVRDFRGLDPKKFDGHGNYNVGIKEQIVFAETIREHMDYTFGLEVNIQTNTDDDKKALELLKSLGFPFQPVERVSKD